jgi:phosphopantothenoylcysteine decarboxylase/phosphopantothenate--cysteine ligase
MASAVEREWKRHDALFMAAAVADFRPKTVAVEKIKKSTGRLLLEMETTDDILSRAAAVKGNRTVVGFALETGDGPARARQKLIDKKLDLICLNNPLEPGSGFETDTNRITLIAANADPVELPLMPKWEAARRILDTVEGRMKTEAAHGVGA